MIATTSELVLTPTGLRFLGRILPVTWGRGGIRSDKREGDGATPVGVHRTLGLLYRPDRIPVDRLPPWAIPIRLEDRWCDAPEHPDYNHLVRKPFGKSQERLRRADPLYDLILPLDWNWPDAQPGRGSAIFIHQWRRPGFPTAGCLALSRRDLLFVARNAAPGTRVVVRRQP
ncbi:L,D-transpeptidase family protein [Defluviimonas sp. WL0002]|uniref:L,D-transpeptidase family protein n=1 Tax=Albidovulum marisflavi TaxID=2984159 RepID=A0ABT2Z7T1_9RHOB|nr:L,D-transpeptidase family protein [Defluviimonas sp. WL0002]MCV2867204.1 L,D-transpeptidase family protein [Defluviimonas sp. WL0002]